MTEPLISVILPIYNVEKYLPKCMESLLAQTYYNLELVMVDDESGELCSTLCDEYASRDKRIKVYHKKNGGLSDARNYGISHSSGEYITCIDPDDYVDKDYVEYLYTLLKKYQCLMSICQHRVRYDNGTVRDYGAKGDEVISTEKCLERMLYHDVIDTSAWAKLYHRSLFQDVSYPVGKLFEDIGTTYRLMVQCNKIAVGYESKYNYIFHENSIVNSDFSPNKLDLIEMTDKMAQDVLRIYPKLESATKRRQVYARFSTLNQMLDTTNYDAEKKEIISYIKENKSNVLKNPRTPKRDKVALLLISCGYRYYRFFWKEYRKVIMKKGL